MSGQPIGPPRTALRGGSVRTAFECGRLGALLLVLLSAPAAAQSAVESGGQGGPCELPPLAAAARPDPESGSTQVSIGLRVLDVLSIDDRGQTVEVDLFWTLSWRDPRLARFVGCRFTADEIWAPALRLLNAGGSFADGEPHCNIGENGEVTLRARMQGTIASPHDLRSFPFDERTISLVARSLDETSEEVDLVVDAEHTYQPDRLSVADWSVRQGKARIERWQAFPGSVAHPTFVYEISARRHVGFYLTKVLLPLMLIVAMSCGVFWLDPQLAAPQIGLASTAVLTLIAHQFSIVDLLPRISYLTKMDRFILGSTVLVFLALVQAVTTSRMASKGHLDRARRLDRICRLAFPAAFFVVVLAAALF